MTNGTRQERSRGGAPAAWIRALLAAVCAVVLAGATPPPAPAESTGQAEPPAASDAELAGSLLTTARTTRPRRAVCGEAQQGGDIVVCGADHGEKWRVPSTADSDPASHQANDNGVPRAPNVSSLPDCRRGCLGFGKAPPPLYIIDLRKMPEAPVGSDADRIAKGELSER